MSISKGNSRAYAAALAKGSARERALQNSGRTHSLGGGETTVKRSHFGPPDADALSQTNNVLANWTVPYAGSGPVAKCSHSAYDAPSSLTIVRVDEAGPSSKDLL